MRGQGAGGNAGAGGYGAGGNTDSAVVSTGDRASSVPGPLPSNYTSKLSLPLDPPSNPSKQSPAPDPPVKSVKVVKPPVKTTDPSGPLLPPYRTVIRKYGYGIGGTGGDGAGEWPSRYGARSGTRAAAVGTGRSRWNRDRRADGQAQTAGPRWRGNAAARLAGGDP
eukprot:3603487-Prymnesium_polylepis.4